MHTFVFSLIVVVVVVIERPYVVYEKVSGLIKSYFVRDFFRLDYTYHLTTSLTH